VLDQPVVRIGRDPTSDVPLVDGKISRQHARIVRVGLGFVVEDLGSTNGTSVNGARIATHLLEPGDEIEIGPFRLRFEGEAAVRPEAARPEAAAPEGAVPEGAVPPAREPQPLPAVPAAGPAPARARAPLPARARPSPWRALSNVFHLGLKELASLRHDLVMVLLIVYGFTGMVYVPAVGTGIEVRNASVAIVDEDRSDLSHRLADALPQPWFQRPVPLSPAGIDPAMDAGRYTFVIDIPPRFEADVLAGHRPQLQINVDATHMSQAGVGSGYLQEIFRTEIERWLRTHHVFRPPDAVDAVVRVRYNPNLYSHWFLGTMMMINVITLLAVVLSGAALIREREHGTLEHLLVMPLTPAEIMLAKVWSNAAIVVVAATLCLVLVIGGLLETPLQGSLALFAFATFLYVFAVTAIGIFLATIARSMPQLGLLSIPVVFPMVALSGNTTPLDSMPQAIQTFMQVSPSTHFVGIAQAVVYRGAGLEVVWRELAIVAVIGLVFFVGALLRLRKSLAAAASA
jgi:ABC-2 type transport system permease protein